MLVTRKSQLSGNVHTLEVPCTPEQLALYEGDRYIKIQDVMPDVPAELREFIMTGITPEEWTAMFGCIDNDDHGDADEPDHGTATEKHEGNYSDEN